MTPLMAVVVTLFVAIFLSSKAPMLLTVLVVIGWVVVIGWLLYREQLLPEVLMDLLDKYTDPDALRRELQEQATASVRIDSEELAAELRTRVIGQDRLIDEVARGISRRAARHRRGKPVFVLLLAGPTGTGKTELAKALSHSLFGNADAMCRVDCGSLGAHGVSTLVGSPRGYAGSDKWGSLTSHLRATPNTVILFDEVEKAGGADSELNKILLALLDEGRVTERSTQETVDATAAVVVLTSNAAARELGELATRYANDPDELRRASRAALEGHMAPELLGRIDEIATTSPLSPEDTARVCVLHLVRLAEDYKLSVDQIDYRLLADAVGRAETLQQYGTRELIRYLERTVGDQFADAAHDGAARVAVHWDDEAPSVEVVEMRQ